MKRFLGEALLGRTANANDEDPWQTFFLLIAKFADMYKGAIQDVSEWKQAEKRLQHKVSAREIQQARALRKVVQTASENSVVLQSRGEELRAVEKRSVSAVKQASIKKSEDAMQAFKDKMLVLRKRNSAAEIEVDSSDDDDDDEW